jgi:hypothetical protein
MPTSMSFKRVCVVIDEEIQLSNENMRRHLFGLEPTLKIGLHTVEDFKKLILSKLPKVDQLLLYHSMLTILDGYIVPLTESISIFRDNDLILLTLPDLLQYRSLLSRKNGIDNNNIQKANTDIVAATSLSSCHSPSQQTVIVKKSRSASSSSKKRICDSDNDENASTSGDQLAELHGENDLNLNRKNKNKSDILTSNVVTKGDSEKRSDVCRRSVTDRKGSSAVNIVSDTKEINIDNTVSNVLDPQLIWQHFNQSNNPTCIVMKKYAPPPKVNVDSVNTNSKTSNRKEKKRKKRELALLDSNNSTKVSDNFNIRINLEGNSSKIPKHKSIFTEMININGTSNGNDGNDDSRMRCNADNRLYPSKNSEKTEGKEYSEDRRGPLNEVSVANYNVLKIGDRISYRTLELCDVTFEPILSNTRIKVGMKVF